MSTKWLCTELIWLNNSQVNIVLKLSDKWNMKRDWHFKLFLNTTTAQVVEIVNSGRQGSVYAQYYGCWSPGDLMSQGMIRNGIALVLLKYPSFSIRKSKTLRLVMLIFFQREHKHMFTFGSFFHIDITQVVEILPQIRQEPTYST